MRSLLLLCLLLAAAPAATAEQSLQAIAIDAALGKPIAIYNLGVEFYTGKRVGRDYAKSAVLWEHAGRLGIVPAKNNFGFLLFNGMGVGRDKPRAVELWREAALKGHDEARWHLGNAIFDGDGIKKDRILGTAWVICAYQAAVSVRDPSVLELAEKSRQKLLDQLGREDRKRAAALADQLMNKYPAVP